MARIDFLSCDWGTTSFRLRRVSAVGHKVVKEIREATGVKTLFEDALRIGAASEDARAIVFARFLSAKLQALFAGDRIPDRPLPLVISGMASSSIGWRELPYAKTPFGLDGQDLLSEQLEWNSGGTAGPTHLISGIATACDMMRGEETEVLGLLMDPGLAEYRKRSLLILPGTHSKHVRIEDGAVIDFSTFMTGELFEVLGRHSILKASVQSGTSLTRRTPSASECDAFQEGLHWVKDRGLAAALFRVRTRAVLGRQSVENNTWFLSGLLIGAELELASRSQDGPRVIIAATQALSDLYALAMETMASPGMQWMRVAPERVEQATIAAHALLLEKKERNT